MSPELERLSTVRRLARFGQTPRVIYRRFGQPWTFIALAVMFGLLTRYANHGSWAWAILAGLLFASVLSGLIAFRHRNDD
jgi:hypothetical protein